MQSVAHSFGQSYAAVPRVVAGARARLADFASAAGADRTQVEAVTLATSEALTNAVLHAYGDRPGKVHVTAAVVAEEVWVLIADDGCGLAPRSDRPGLGLGLGLIAQLSDHLAIVPRSGGVRKCACASTWFQPWPGALAPRMRDDDALDRRQLVTANHHEMPRVGAHPLVIDLTKNRLVGASRLSGSVVSRLADRLGGFGAHDLIGLIVMLTVDRALEVVDAATDGAAHLGQPLGAQNHQRDHENQEKMRGLENVTDHAETIIPCLTPRPRSHPDAST